VDSRQRATSCCSRTRRGSTVYGQDFGNIIQYHYPGDEYKDLMAASTKWLEKKVYVTPAAFGVTGGSGGGLLTNGPSRRRSASRRRFHNATSRTGTGFWFTADFTLFQPTWFRKAPWEDPHDFARGRRSRTSPNVTTPLMLGERGRRLPHAAR